MNPTSATIRRIWQSIWPWVWCRHHCSCVGNTSAYGHNASCRRNPLHAPFHRRQR